MTDNGHGTDKATYRGTSYRSAQKDDLKNADNLKNEDNLKINTPSKMNTT